MKKKKKWKVLCAAYWRTREDTILFVSVWLKEGALRKSLLKDWLVNPEQQSSLRSYLTALHCQIHRLPPKEGLCLRLYLLFHNCLVHADAWICLKNCWFCASCSLPSGPCQSCSLRWGHIHDTLQMILSRHSQPMKSSKDLWWSPWDWGSQDASRESRGRKQWFKVLFIIWDEP